MAPKWTPQQQRRLAEGSCGRPSRTGCGVAPHCPGPDSHWRRGVEEQTWRAMGVTDSPSPSKFGRRLCKSRRDPPAEREGQGSFFFFFPFLGIVRFKTSRITTHTRAQGFPLWKWWPLRGAQVFPPSDAIIVIEYEHFALRPQRATPGVCQVDAHPPLSLADPVLGAFLVRSLTPRRRGPEIPFPGGGRAPHGTP